jgi:hypothetical protein
MQAADFLGAVEIGQRAGNPKHAVIAARGEPHGVGGQKPSYFFVVRQADDPFLTWRCGSNKQSGC